MIASQSYKIFQENAYINISKWLLILTASIGYFNCGIQTNDTFMLAISIVGFLTSLGMRNLTLLKRITVIQPNTK